MLFKRKKSSGKRNNILEQNFDNRASGHENYKAATKEEGKKNETR